ncbi:MAG: DNA primase [Candidatus Ratteibacteria bacterium]|nr:DNA primase [Candidatus Ratteibacteria bacterium]
MIPEEKINEILGLTDIVRIIGEFYPLKSAGRNYKILCPFHQEKTPSFIVSPEKQIFHCFGCGKGGNVFHFIMEHEKLSFPEAVEWVAKKIGVIVENKPAGKTSKLYPVLEQVNLLFAKFLYSTQGKEAHQYLIKRGLKERTLKDFLLGYAPTAEVQLKELNNLNLASEQLIKSGVLLKKDNKNYPYFRRRVIFPIFNPQGKTIAFGGRSTDDSLPKYLNSPESEVFEKGKILYGLNLTRKNILAEKSAIIVEGYMDLISLYEAGIKNIVASLGTSLTRWQIRILSRLADTIYIVYDSDAAGERASLRSLELFIEEGLNPLAVKLPYPEDPDTYIKRYGKEKFKAKLNQSQNIVEFYLSCLEKQYDCKTIEGKVNISKVILPIINKVQSSIRKNEYIKMLADALDSDEKVLMEEMSKKGKKLEYSGEKINYRLSFPPEEELTLSSMITENDILEEDINEFQDDNLKEIAWEVYSKAKEKGQIKLSAILNFLSPNAREILSKIMANEFLPQYPPQQIIQNWRKKNKDKRYRKEQIEKLQKLIT